METTTESSAAVVLTHVTAGRDIAITIINYVSQPDHPIRDRSTLAVGAEANPYRGLFTFRPVDAPYFRGRASAVSSLIDLVQRSQVAVLAGPSGSGKSSVVFAGLIPELEKSDPSWLFSTFRPGANPIRSLASALYPLQRTLDVSISIQAFTHELMTGQLTLPDVLQAINTLHPQEHLLLVADQFEELFTQCQDARIRDRFLDLLASVVHSDYSFFRLVLTLRTDFLDDVLQSNPFGDVVRNSIQWLGPMSAANLREVIDVPARLNNVQFQDGLVDTILADAGTVRGSLALLEFALTLLWDQQSADGEITFVAYREIGGVSGAIARHISDVFESLSFSDQDETRRLFKRLVRIPLQDDANITERATSQRVSMDDLDDETKRLIQKTLSRERLVITHREERGEIVEIVHESLIREWGQLAIWLREDAEIQRRRQELSDETSRWLQSGKHKDFLLRGDRLRSYLAWMAKNADVLNTSEREYLGQSRVQARRNTLWQIFGYSATVLVMVVIAGTFFLKRGGVEPLPPPRPTVPVPMPSNDFNVAIATFGIQDLNLVADATLSDQLVREADGFAQTTAKLFQYLEPELETNLNGRSINTLFPDRFAVNSSDRQTMQARAQDVRADIVVYGIMSQAEGIQWSIQPQFFVTDRAVNTRAAEALQDNNLGKKIRYKPGNQDEIARVNAQLEKRIRRLLSFIDGLSAYDLDSPEGYTEAADIFCSAASEGQQTGDTEALELLFLFCGHAKATLYYITKDVGSNSGLLDEAVTAYESGLEINPDHMRLRVSLAALLVDKGEPQGYRCTDGDIPALTKAADILDAALSNPEQMADSPSNTMIGAYLYSGHAHFWLGVCHVEQGPEQWELAQNRYLTILERSGNTPLRADIINGFIAQTHRNLGLMGLLIYLGIFNNYTPVDQAILAPEALDHFEKAIRAWAEFKDDGTAYTAAIQTLPWAMVAFCQAGQKDRGEALLDEFVTGLSEPEALRESVLGNPLVQGACTL